MGRAQAGLLFLEAAPKMFLQLRHEPRVAPGAAVDDSKLGCAVDEVK
jgi:hypothetical protein